MGQEGSCLVSTNRLGIGGRADRASSARTRTRTTTTRTTTIMMPRTTGIWLLVAMVCLAATVARAYDDMGDVTTYWQKRTQETGFKRGGPLRDIVNAAARYHQELNGNKFGGGRYLLEEQAAAEAPAASTGAAAPPPADPSVHNTLADHEMV